MALAQFEEIQSNSIEMNADLKLKTDISMKNKGLKEKLIIRLNELLDTKIHETRAAIESAKESRDSDTKSSAGDKYETGRAMMQFELEKNELLLSKALKQKIELLKIDCTKVSTKVEFGSLIETNFGIYFLALALGNIEIEEQSCFCISMAAPLGQILLNKRAGDSFEFLDKTYEIIKVW